jgi:hypothetical protein
MLGALASRTQYKPYTSVTGSGPYVVTGTDSRTNFPYSFTTDRPRGDSFQEKEGDERALSGTWRWESTTNATGPSGRTGVIELFSYGNCQSSSPSNATFGSYCSVFGPEVWSDTFSASQGESLSFSWAAEGGGDDYETYAFLVNTANNDHTLLAYGRGGVQPWTVSTGTIPANGTYRFRFVNGSYDRTGGYLLGAKMFIDPAITVGQTQMISVGNIGSQGVSGSLDLTSIVTASSGLPVTLVSTSTGRCTVNGMTVNFLSAGQCQLTADQAGDGTFAPAASVSFSIEVLQLQNQTINFATPDGRTYGDAAFGVSATATSGLAVSFSSLTTSVCTISGTTVTAITNGTCTLRAARRAKLGSDTAVPP